MVGIIFKIFPSSIGLTPAEQKAKFTELVEATLRSGISKISTQNPLAEYFWLPNSNPPPDGRILIDNPNSKRGKGSFYAPDKGKAYYDQLP